MNSKKLIYKKGFTLKISSSENDLNAQRDIFYHVDTLEEVKELYSICKMFETDFGFGKTLGNCLDLSNHIDLIRETLNKCPIFLEKWTKGWFNENDEHILTDEDYNLLISEISYELFGPSDIGVFRCFDDIEVFFTSDDIFIKDLSSEIKRN